MNELIDITLKGYRCLRCLHEWIPDKKYQNEKPRTCPSCKSAYWDIARKNKKKVKKDGKM
jgi:DNA-directed RNA polymerase subunit RPC12/RpoP